MEIKFITELAPDWRKIAQLLGFSFAEIRGIENPGSGKTPENCLSEVFEQWLKKPRQYPGSWSGFYNLLVDAEYTVLAGKLQAIIQARQQAMQQMVSIIIIIIIDVARTPFCFTFRWLDMV